MQFSGSTTEAPSEDTVLLMTGGYNNGRLSSTEIYPAVSGCSPPALPEGRNAHSTFATTGASPKLVICGGNNGGWTASCLVMTKQGFSEAMIGQLPQKRGYHAAVSVENIGTYLIGGSLPGNARTTDFLQDGSTQWVAGPVITVDMNRPCAVKISNQSFIIIYRNDIREYEVDITNPTSDSGWQSATKWPQLQTSRYSQPGCSKIDNRIVIAGGFSSGQYLQSTEVLDLKTNSLVYAGDLNSPRGWFHMATIRRDGQQLILAFGGYNGPSSTLNNVSILNSVEQFNPSNNTWTLAPTTMEEARRQFGAVVVLKKMVCPAT